MNNQEYEMMSTAPERPGLLPDSKGLPTSNRSVFSRFCRCGANITIGLVSDQGYVNAQASWSVEHSGPGHEDISRQQWLLDKLKNLS